MLVGDIIYNDNFDFNANYAIFQCNKKEVWYDKDKPIYSTAQNGYSKPPAKILDLSVKYLTISDNVLIIEVPDESEKDD